LINRVLVVDDYERWRRHIVSAIQKHPRWQVVGEADDGLDAIQKARTLAPDLILLDISMPSLDGIEAARRIIASDPGARIVFLSEHRSLDIVNAALSTNARGYVVKSDAGLDLLRAMEAVLDGKQFVSASLNGNGAGGARRGAVDGKNHCHEIGLYTDETSLLDAYADFAAAALEQGYAVLVAATVERHRKIKDRLLARRLDVDAAVNDGRYRPIEVGEMLATFMNGNRLDERRFMDAATALIRQAKAVSGGRVAACGDGAWTLVANRMPEAAIQLERLWDELGRRYDVNMFCGYSSATLSVADADRLAERLRAVHSAVRAQ
jgi:DNA-binding NarL/FixJ family response regulator